MRDCKRRTTTVAADRASGNVDCPTVQALADATRDNIENNMVTLLVIGALGLIRDAAVLLPRSKGYPQKKVRVFWLGFTIAAAVYAAGAVAYFRYTDWFIRYGHYVGGGGLLVCLLVVALANARRRGREQAGSASSSADHNTPVNRASHYALIAAVMAAVTLILTPLMAFGKLSLFWLEVVVGVLFIVFWLVQTIEQGDTEPTVR